MASPIDRSARPRTREVGADTSQIVFEVVESERFPDVSQLRTILAFYRRAGARVALDDLGAGNTSIVFIDDLGPDSIKIDKQIVSRAVETGEIWLLHGLVRHAQQKGIRFIAEGVGFVRGWLIGRPAAEAAREFPDIARAA